MLPGIQLIIGLCHKTGEEPVGGGARPTGPRPHRKSDHDHVLEHSLHQLLRQAHHTNTHHPFPHPACGPLGPSKRRCLAGITSTYNY